jgi:hypothetical protein
MLLSWPCLAIGFFAVEDAFNFQILAVVAEEDAVILSAET